MRIIFFRISVYNLTFLVLMLMVFYSTNAQVKIDGFSGSIKLGFNIMHDQYIEGIEGNILNNNTIYTMGYYYGEDYEMWVSPDERYNQFNLIIGKFHNARKLRIQVQGGIGLFWGLKRTERRISNFWSILNTNYESEDFVTIGFPIKISASFIPLHYMSIGVELQANINSTKSIIRPMLSLDFGKLRKNSKSIE